MSQLETVLYLSILQSSNVKQTIIYHVVNSILFVFRFSLLNALFLHIAIKVNYFCLLLPCLVCSCYYNGEVNDEMKIYKSLDYLKVN